MFDTKSQIEKEWEHFFGLGTTTQYHVTSKDGNTILDIDVMGLDPKNIDVDIDGHILNINGKKNKDDSELLRDVKLKFTIPETLSTSPTSAEVKNGLLTLVFEPETKTVKTAIKLKF